MRIPPSIRYGGLRFGEVRFPSDTSAPLPNNEVKVYHVNDLPPEEREKYLPTRPTRDDLLAAQAAGLTLEDVAEQYEISAGRVADMSKILRIPLMRRLADPKGTKVEGHRKQEGDDVEQVVVRTPKLDKEALHAAFEAGKGDKELAELYGVTQQAIWYHRRWWLRERRASKSVGVESAAELDTDLPDPEPAGTNELPEPPFASAEKETVTSASDLTWELRVSGPMPLSRLWALVGALEQAMEPDESTHVHLSIGRGR